MQDEHLTQHEAPQIEKILKTKYIAGIKYNLVSWKNWPSFYSTWIPETNISTKENSVTKSLYQKKSKKFEKKIRVPFQIISNNKRFNVSKLSLDEGKNVKEKISKKIFKFKPEGSYLRKKQRYSIKRWYNLRIRTKKKEKNSSKESQKPNCFSFKNPVIPNEKNISNLSFQSKKNLSNVVLDFKFDLNEVKKNSFEKIENLLSAKSTIANFNNDEEEEDKLSNGGLSFSLNLSKKNCEENPFKSVKKFDFCLRKKKIEEPLFYSPMMKRRKLKKGGLRSLKASPKFLKF